MIFKTGDTKLFGFIPVKNHGMAVVFKLAAVTGSGTEFLWIKVGWSEAMAVAERSNEGLKSLKFTNGFIAGNILSGEKLNIDEDTQVVIIKVFSREDNPERLQLVSSKEPEPHWEEMLKEERTRKKSGG